LSTEVLRTFKSFTVIPLAPPFGPDSDGKLSGGEVEHRQANKLRGSSIGLTCERLVEEDWPGKSPTSGSGGAPAGTQTVVRGKAMLNNALPRELPCGLGKTLGRPRGAEDRRRGELGSGGPAAAEGARAPASRQLG
jgi:hypothetical protein